MALLVEGYAIVILEEALRTRYLKGYKYFKANQPHERHSTDGLIHQISFLKYEEANFMAHELIENGLNFLDLDLPVDFVMVNMIEGVYTINPWLRFVRGPFFSHYEQFTHRNENFSVVNYVKAMDKKKDEIIEIFAPKKWNPDEALYGSEYLSPDQLSSQFYTLEDEDGETIYFLQKNNEQIFI